MPRLKDLQCTIEYGPENAHLREYGTTYGDGLVESHVAVPTQPVPFSIHLTSLDYIAPGLAMFVYIDAVPQCNRNRRGLVSPEKATKNDPIKVDFRVRQKEEKVDEGRWIGREWTFAELNTTINDNTAELDEDILQNLGTIEVVVLRCFDEPNVTKNKTKSGGNNKVANLDGTNDSNGQAWSINDFGFGFDGNSSPTNKYDARYRRSCFASKGLDGPPPSSSFATYPYVSNGHRATPVILYQYFANPPSMYSDPNSQNHLNGIEAAFAKHGFTAPNTSPQHARSSSRVHWPDQTNNQAPPWQSANAHTQPGYMGPPPGFPFNIQAPQQWHGHQRHSSGGGPPLNPDVHDRIYRSYWGAPSDQAESVQMNQTPWPTGTGPVPPNWPPGYPWWPGYHPGAYGNWSKSPGPSQSQSQPHASGVVDLGTGTWKPSGEKQKKSSGPQNSPNASNHSSQNNDKGWGDSDSNAWGQNNNGWANTDDNKNDGGWTNNDTNHNTGDGNGGDAPWATNDNANDNNPTSGWDDNSGNNGNATTGVGGWDGSGNDAGNSNNSNDNNQNSSSWDTAPAQDNSWATSNNDNNNNTAGDWSAPTKDNNNSNTQKQSNSSHKRDTPKKKHDKTTTSNSKSKTPEGAPSSTKLKKPIDPSRPFIKPYWTPNDADQQHALANPASLAPAADTPRDASNSLDSNSAIYITPALPLHPVPTALASQQQKSHQVRFGPGAVYYHRTGRPAYMDSLENPYAVFVFRYRSAEMLRRILPGEDVKEEKGRGGQYRKRIMGMSKEEIFGELVRAKRSAGYGTDSSLEESGGEEVGEEVDVARDKGKGKGKEEVGGWDAGGCNQPAGGW